MRSGTTAVCMAGLLLGLAGCSDDGGRVRDGASPSPTEALTDPFAATRLTTLAGAAAAAVYDATYAFATRGGQDAGTLRIVASPPSYRVDVAGAAGTSVFITTPTGTVSCDVAASARCVTVARPGEPVPSVFDPGVQRLFSSAVADLARNPASYRVLGLPDDAGRGAVPAAQCFTVDRAVPLATAVPSPGSDVGDPTGFETGTYCFAQTGVPTRVVTLLGSLTLRTVSYDVPATAFDPPAKPTTLRPSASASSS